MDILLYILLHLPRYEYEAQWQYCYSLLNNIHKYSLVTNYFVNIYCLILLNPCALFYPALDAHAVPSEAETLSDVVVSNTRNKRRLF